MTCAPSRARTNWEPDSPPPMSTTRSPLLTGATWKAQAYSTMRVELFSWNANGPTRRAR